MATRCGILQPMKKLLRNTKFTGLTVLASGLFLTIDAWFIPQKNTGPLFWLWISIWPVYFVFCFLWGRAGRIKHKEQREEQFYKSITKAASYLYGVGQQTKPLEPKDWE
jgi:hypothetical protein